MTVSIEALEHLTIEPTSNGLDPLENLTVGIRHSDHYATSQLHQEMGAAVLGLITPGVLAADEPVHLGKCYGGTPEDADMQGVLVSSLPGVHVVLPGVSATDGGETLEGVSCTVYGTTFQLDGQVCDVQIRRTVLDLGDMDSANFGGRPVVYYSGASNLVPR